MSTPITIAEIEGKMREIDTKLTDIKNSMKTAPQNIGSNLIQFKQDINEILQSIDVVSGSEYRGGKIYIRLLLKDLADPNKQSKYFSLNPITPSSLLKAEIDLLKKLVSDNQKLKEKFIEGFAEIQPAIDSNLQTNIKAAINAVDSSIGL